MASQRLLFFLKGLRNPLVNASLAPSSRIAAEHMMRDIDFSRIQSVVELGPGTGPYTEMLLERCMSETKIFLIELDPTYCFLLRHKFGERVVVINAGAERFMEIVRQHDIERPDLIVSALPFLPMPERKLLFESIRYCTERGTILRFEIILLPWGLRVYKPLPIKKQSFILQNIPPMWIYGIN